MVKHIFVSFLKAKDLTRYLVLRNKLNLNFHFLSMNDFSTWLAIVRSYEKKVD